MLNNYTSTLKNEIVSNFGIYKGENEFKFIFTFKSSKELKVDYGAIYEKMFGSKKNYTHYSIVALNRFYGNVNDGLKKAMTDILSGNFEGVKSRDPDAIKVITVLSEIVDIIDRGNSREIISSVRDADSEFNNLKLVLNKLAGLFAKEDSDRFTVISKLYSYFKNKNSKQFNPLVKKYAEISETPTTFENATKTNKKATTALIEMFNTNEADYSATIEELLSLSPSLFGKDVSEIKELMSDQIGDAEIDNYKPLISFYAQHLDSLVDLAKEDLATIVTQYSALEDKNVASMRESTIGEFGEHSIVHERIRGSREYLFAVSFLGRYEKILKFIEDNELKVFTVLMVLPEVDPPINTNPSLAFLLTAFSEDIDEAIDEYGKKPNLDTRKLGNNTAVYLLGTASNDDKGKEHAMMTYLSILAVIHGFDATKLPFVQKFI